eukprot:1154343-Pelagomonas_calceolata.AAC.9
MCGWAACPLPTPLSGRPPTSLPSSSERGPSRAPMAGMRWGRSWSLDVRMRVYVSDQWVRQGIQSEEQSRSKMDWCISLCAWHDCLCEKH